MVETITSGAQLRTQAGCNRTRMHGRACMEEMAASPHPSLQAALTAGLSPPPVQHLRQHTLTGRVCAVASSSSAVATCEDWFKTLLLTSHLPAHTGLLALLTPCPAQTSPLQRTRSSLCFQRSRSSLLLSGATSLSWPPLHSGQHHRHWVRRNAGMCSRTTQSVHHLSTVLP